MSALNRLNLVRILIVFNGLSPNSNNAFADMVISPQWDTSGNYSNRCSYREQDDNSTISFYGNSMHFCSAHISSTKSVISIKVSEHATDDYLLYITPIATSSKDCPEESVAAIHGDHKGPCNTFVYSTKCQLNLQGNVSIDIAEVSADHFEAACPVVGDCLPCVNQTLPSCEVKNYDEVLTCDLRDESICKLSFPPKCNATLDYREVLLSCEGNKNDYYKNNLVSYPNNILHLNATDSNLVEIKIGAFRNLHQLESIRLGLNRIQTLIPGVFDDLTRLTLLSLRSNALSYLATGLFQDLTILSVLDISNNALYNLPPDIFKNLLGLKELLLNGNELTTLHKDLFQNLTYLETLDLSGNKINGLPVGAFDPLFRLEKLFISENQLERLEDNLFQNLANLIRLYLVDNKLHSIENGAFNGLKSVKYLRLSGNQLVGYYSELFNDVVSVSSIHLQRNKLDSITGGLFKKMRRLHAINLSENKLKTLPVEFLEGVPHVDILNLRDNHIDHLPQEVFKGVIELRVLYLDNNRLETLQNGLFIDQGNMTKFVAPGNNMKEIGFDIFANTRKLQHLDLSNNTLESVPNFNGLKQLSFIELTGNGLRDIGKASFGGIPSGGNLFVSQHEICECYTVGLNCSASSNRSPFLTCDRLLSDRVLVVMMWLIGINALGGNVFVLWYKSKYNKNRVQSFLYNNLAMSDFLMGVYMIIIAIADSYFAEEFPLRAEEWRPGITCKISGALSIISSECSVFFITFISIDRFMSVKYPQSYFKLRSQWTKITAALLWIFSAVLGIVPSSLAGRNPNFYDNSHVCIGLPLALYETYTKTNSRKVAGSHTQTYIEFSQWFSTGQKVGMYYSVAVFLGLNCACYLVIVICYIAIIRTVYMSSKRAGLNSEMKTQIRLTLKVAAIVITDFVCWFPIIVLGILVQFQVLTLPPSVFAWAVTFVLPINSALNPYLYTIADAISSRRKQWLESKSQSMSQRSRASRVDGDGNDVTNTESRAKTITTSIPPAGSNTMPLPNVPDHSENMNSNV